jgi:hypothetical protein
LSGSCQAQEVFATDAHLLSAGSHHLPCEFFLTIHAPKVLDRDAHRNESMRMVEELKDGGEEKEEGKKNGKGEKDEIQKAGP